jgi:hypothetical protein
MWQLPPSSRDVLASRLAIWPTGLYLIDKMKSVSFFEKGQINDAKLRQYL